VSRGGRPKLGAMVGCGEQGRRLFLTVRTGALAFDVQNVPVLVPLASDVAGRVSARAIRHALRGCCVVPGESAQKHAAVTPDRPYDAEARAHVPPLAAWMREIGQALTLPPGTVLAHEGASVRHVFLVERGCVWVNRCGEAAPRRRSRSRDRARSSGSRRPSCTGRTSARRLFA